MPLDDEQLAQMTHAELFLAREKPGADQRRLAPAEHRAFAREAVEENPIMALSLGIAIPAYTAAKMLANVSKDVPLFSTLFSAANLDKSRSGASLKEVTEGFKGISEGLNRSATRLSSSAFSAGKNLLP